MNVGAPGEAKMTASRTDPVALIDVGATAGAHAGGGAVPNLAFDADDDDGDGAHH
jgi:hypothetical protein